MSNLKLCRKANGGLMPVQCYPFKVCKKIVRSHVVAPTSAPWELPAMQGARVVEEKLSLKGLRPKACRKARFFFSYLSLQRLRCVIAWSATHVIRLLACWSMPGLKPKNCQMLSWGLCQHGEVLHRSTLTKSCGLDVSSLARPHSTGKMLSCYTGRF